MYIWREWSKIGKDSIDKRLIDVFNIRLKGYEGVYTRKRHS